MPLAPLIHPEDAAVEALVAYFTSAVPSLSGVLSSYPEHAVRLDLAAGPVLSLSSVEGPREPHPPEELPDLTTGAGTGTLTVYYKVATQTITIQADLWCAYKEIRNEVGQLVEEAMDNSAPFGTGIRVTMPRYYDLNLTGRSSSPGSNVDADTTQSAPRGEWAKRWTLTCEVPIVKARTWPEFVDGRLRTVMGGDAGLIPERMVAP